MFYPAPELPDGTLILNVRFSTRIRKALNAGGMKTIGEIREASDAKLLSLPDFGKESVAYLRQTLGLMPGRTCSPATDHSFGRRVRLSRRRLDDRVEL